MDKKIRVLASFLSVEHGDIEIVEDNQVYAYRGEEYLVCTDEEADKFAEEYILDELFNFEDDYIIDHAQTGLLYSSSLDYALLKVIKSMDIEQANSILNRLIDDNFVDNVRREFGRAYFLSAYNKKEEYLDGFYLYRRC